ncbi:MAG: hypothetical protein ACTSO7_04345 [Candidatus Heimdallarchaeota archaeon]
MKPFKLLSTIVIFTLLAISLNSTSLVLGGWETDPAGDADGYDSCDILQVNVDVDYNDPEDDEIILKITLADNITKNDSLTFNWYDFNFYVDTSLSTCNMTEILGMDGGDVYEYRAHLSLYCTSGNWVNSSYLYATRYYYTGDGQGKTMGDFYWNPNTESWQGTDPGLDVAEVIDNTIVWDVTGAIYREQPIGTGYVVQGAVSTSFGWVVRDTSHASDWIDEFDNCCEIPTGSSTPLFPAPGIIASFAFLAAASLITIVYKKKR